ETLWRRLFGNAHHPPFARDRHLPGSSRYPGAPAAPGRISPVLGYLLIGAIVAPFGLGLLVADHAWLGYFVISDLAGVQALAELGVIFLLFMIGLELSLDRLWEMRRLVFGLGSLQVIITAV